MSSDSGSNLGVLAAIDKGVQALLSSLSDGKAALSNLRDFDLHRLGHLLDHVLELLHHNLPEAERLLYSWADTIFAPKVVVRQYLIALGLELGLFIYHLASRLGTRMVNRMTVKGRQISDTRRRMAKAKNYYEWLKCAERMDELEGKNKWREVPECNLYNHRMLQEKINQLNNMMQNGDVFQLMFVLRGGISRNQFGLLNEGLYQHAYSGTKKIVERYLEVSFSFVSSSIKKSACRAVLLSWALHAFLLSVAQVMIWQCLAYSFNDAFVVSFECSQNFPSSIVRLFCQS